MVHVSSEKRDQSPPTQDSYDKQPILKRIISISTLIKFLVLGLLAVIDYFLVSYVYLFENSNYLPIIIILIITFFFLTWTACLYLFFSLTITELENSLFNKLFSLLLVMGVLSAYFAVVIENKSFTLVSIVAGFFSSIGYFPDVYSNIHFIFYVFVIPIVEEIAKVFPIIILTGNFARIHLRSKKSIHTKLTPSFRTFILLGGFFGAWFDLFEQLLSYSSSIPESVIDYLIFKRSIFPLHTVTTMIVSTGLGLVFLYRNRLSRSSKFGVFGVFLVLGSAYHGFWNYNTVFNLNSITREYIFQIMGILSYIIFAVFVILLVIKSPVYCNQCNTEHFSKVCPEIPSLKSSQKEDLEKARRMEPLYDKETNMMVCSQCKTPVFTGNYCLNCWSFPKIQCNNCNQVLPAFSRICWSCGTEVTTLYEKMSSSSPTFLSTLSVGFTRILAVGMLISFIFTFVTIDNTITFLGYTVFLLAIILAICITVIWYRYKTSRVKAILSSISLLSIIAISIVVTSLYMIVFSILMILTILQIVYGIVGLLSTLTIVTASLYFLVKSTKGVRLIVL